MEPEQAYFLKNTEQKNTNGFAINGSQLHADFRLNTMDGKPRERKKMLRLHKLKKQNKWFKSVQEKHKNEIAGIIASNKKYISVLAHDLKSPFSTIYGVLGLLKDCIRENNFEEMEEYIDIASCSSINATNLIENILTWEHTRNKCHEPVTINLANLIRYETGNSLLAVKLKKITLTHYVPSTYFVHADIQMSQSIIRNLITNAIKFTPSGGNISISAAMIKSMIEITVQDDGIGMSEQQLQELFTEAPQVVLDNNNLKGKGLGLVLAKEFVGIHGGTLRVESVKGQGSSFSLLCPVWRNDAE
jgi:two-component system, sensor histidine kinase and response regulator